MFRILSFTFDVSVSILHVLGFELINLPWGTFARGLGLIAASFRSLTLHSISHFRRKHQEIRSAEETAKARKKKMQEDEEDLQWHWPDDAMLRESKAQGTAWNS